MNAAETSKTVHRLLAVGPFLVSIFVLSTTNTDPVNVTKLFLLGGVGVAALLVYVASGIQASWKLFKSTLLIVGIFDLLLLVSLLTSNAPFTQNFFGTYGRNNGVLTYLLFTFIVLASLLIEEKKNFQTLIYAFLAAGLINILYCAWVLAFGDFIGWNNQYRSILGLLGNPDFISALLGMYFSCCMAIIVSNSQSITTRICILISALAAFFEILKSHAIQGLVISVGGLGVVAFFQIRARFKSNLIQITYLLVSFTIGALAVLGTLQEGPLNFLYKRSVSLRGSYWRAGINMGLSHPLTGVGMDTYGDWYRRSRPAVALIDTPGVNTVSNVSHNVLIDFFASGGFPLMLSYLAILSLGAVAIVRFSSRTKKYDPLFVSMASVWTCYEVQSLISINQIGLAIWGWLFTGLLISYEMVTRPKEQIDSKKHKSFSRRIEKRNASALSPNLIVGVGIFVGLMLAAPPFLADSKWLSALKSRSLLNVEAALTTSTFNPSDSAKFFQAVNIFETSNLPDQAHNYALKAVQFNPDYFDAWKQLYFLPTASNAEKEKALANMKRLDPKNPDVTAP